MSLQVVGAGLPRTGTTSLKAALEQLLGGPCYHMLEVFSRLDSHGPAWISASGGDHSQLGVTLDGFVAAVDWPASAFWPELSERHPEARVLLSRRSDPETWWRSIDRTVGQATRDLPPGELYTDFIAGLLARLGIDGFDDPDEAMRAYEAHNERVRDSVPADRLIEWQPTDGWGPLCAGLGVDEPTDPFPHNNTTSDFRAMAGWDRAGARPSWGAGAPPLPCLAMGRALDQLLDVLDLERIDRDIFRGQNEPSDWFRLFGGQVAAQALAAAQRTVDEHRAHSLHGYFLRGGDPKTPVTYTVDRIRDGRSFSTRRVVALQDGRAIFNTSISFHTHEDGYEHQDPMPDVPDPETLPTWAERAAKLEGKIPAERLEWMKRERAIDTRSALPHSMFSGEPSTEPNPVWIRANGDVPDDPDIHAQLLTYASDIAFVDNMYRPHRRPGGPGIMLASLDHALWFHRPLRMDDWLLFIQDSPSAAGARGFARGAIYDRGGVHLASVAQEGVMRELDPERADPATAHN